MQAGTSISTYAVLTPSLREEMLVPNARTACTLQDTLQCITQPWLLGTPLPVWMCRFAPCQRVPCFPWEGNRGAHGQGRTWRTANTPGWGGNGTRPVGSSQSRRQPEVVLGD